MTSSDSQTSSPPFSPITSKRVLLSGNQAVARGAYECGVTVATSYPGTPCTEILETLATYDSIKAMWSANEKVALETALGAAFAGARALVSMKHVGLNVAADPLFSSAYTGINGGLVIVVGDDPSANSSQNEQDSRHYARAAKLPMLEPSNSQEIKDLMAHAFELSEQFDTPVILRLTTRLCHSKTVVRLGTPPKTPKGASGFVRDFDKFVLLPRQALLRHSVIENRLLALAENAEKLPFNVTEIRDRDLGIVTAGMAYNYVREAFPDASVLKLAQTFPLPAKLIREFATEVNRLLVIEELDPFLDEQIRALGVTVEQADWLPRVGELSPERIERSLTRGTPQPLEKGDEAIPPRAPRICAGCQYLGVYTAIARLGVTVAGDIGCYTLGSLSPWNAIDTVVCMGASIGTALGMEKALGEESHGKVLAIIGDGTLLHSGLAPLLDFVHNGGRGTILIMDNSTTAMTGLQGHSGNGKLAQGENSAGQGIDLEKLVRALGVEWVRVADPYNLEETEAILREALDYAGPAVVISRAPCLLIKPKPPVQRAQWNAEACTGCGDCFEVGCVAIEPQEFQGRYAPKISQDLCVGCTLCVQVCPEGALKPRPVSGDLIELGMWKPQAQPMSR
jgi:indolepyruvate ferredoxin oxidoreductase alpha subunit